jgi:hypothetical protein
MRTTPLATLLALLSLPLLLMGCPDTSPGDDDDDDADDEYEVVATVDGEAYEGNSQGAVFMDYGETTELMLWPADAISGSVLGWMPGDTGSWQLTDGDDFEAMLIYIDDASTQYTSSSGTFVIDSWEENNGGATDPRIGFISGTFEGTFTEFGGTATLEVTGGQFDSMVTAQ